ncbi:hypothetical protein BDD12DRAFT_876388 [Trichophaea hybrida]|nr:hypothetical protein BDD12DRAFT_876388 [Trichophaea hybrida]
MISSVSYAENIDPVLLQFSSSASSPPSAIPPLLPPPPSTITSLRSYNHTSAVTSLHSATAPPPSHLSAPTNVPSLSCSSAPTTAPLPSHPTAPKQRLTLSSFPVPASTVSNPGTRATVIKRAKMLYKDYIENYELTRSMTNKWNQQYGDNKTWSEDSIRTLIHHISLDNIRNTVTKAEWRMAKANGKSASPFDNEDVSPAPSVSQKPKTSSPNYTPPLTSTPVNTAPTITAAVASPTTATPVAAPPSVPTPPQATTSWKALNPEVTVRVRNNNDTAKVYIKVVGPEEWRSGTDDNVSYQPQTPYVPLSSNDQASVLPSLPTLPPPPPPSSPSSQPQISDLQLLDLFCLPTKIKVDCLIRPSIVLTIARLRKKAATQQNQVQPTTNTQHRQIPFILKSHVGELPSQGAKVEMMHYFRAICNQR